MVEFDQDVIDRRVVGRKWLPASRHRTRRTVILAETRHDRHGYEGRTARALTLYVEVR